MKIIYCYIKKFKKIEEFQTNFLSNSKFTLVERDNEYILTEEDRINEQPEKFYGKNISNITGIIGENGTGKSTILEILFRELIDTQIRPIGNSWKGIAVESIPKFLNLFIIFETKIKKGKKERKYYSTLNKDILLENGDTVVEALTVGTESEKVIKTFIKDTSYLYIDDIFTRKSFSREILYESSSKPNSIEYRLKKHDYSASNLIQNDSMNLLTYANSDLKRVITFLMKYKWKEIDKKLSINVPGSLYLSLGYNLGINSIEGFYKNMIKDCSNFLEKKSKNLNNSSSKIIECYKSEIEVQNIIEKIAKKILLNVAESKELIDNLYSIDIEKIDEKAETIFVLMNTYRDRLYKKYNFYHEVIDRIMNIVNFYIYLYYPYSQEKYKNFKIINDNQDKNNGKIEINLKNNFKYDVKIFLNYFRYTSQSERLIYHFDIELSSGEKSLITLLSKLYEVFYIKKSKDHKNWIIFLDEPENMMHPEWQRSILNILIGFINNRDKSDFSVQVMVTSHSPYLVSDLPKENLIMLRNIKERDDTPALDKKMEEVLKKEKTFASNIYDLQQDSFFMKSSLGKFSTDKLQKVINFLTPNKNGEYKYKEITEEEVKYVINSVGEKQIKVKLEMMLEHYCMTNKKPKVIKELTPDEMAEALSKLSPEMLKEVLNNG